MNFESMIKKVNLFVIGPNPEMKYRNGGVAKYVEYQQPIKDYKDQINVRFIYLDIGWISFSKTLSKLIAFVNLLVRITFTTSQNKIIHLHVSLYDRSAIKNFFIAKLCSAKGLKLLVQIHGGRFTTISSKKLKYWKSTFALATKVGVFPGPQFNELVEKGYGGKLVELANFVPDKNYEVNNSDSVEILFLGRIEVEKGVFILLEAFEKLRTDGLSAHLTYAGNGSKLDELKSKVQNLNFKKDISVLGYIDGAELDEALKSNNIFVLPSYQEGFPLSFLECSLRGMAPLITTNNAIPYFFEIGNEYLPIDINVADHLYDQLYKICNDYKLRRNIGEAVKEKVENGFTVNTYLPKLLKLYHEL